MHIASMTAWLLDLARIRIPRALCGASLEGDPDRPDAVSAGGAVCPACLRYGTPGKLVPGRLARYLQ